MTIRFGVLGAIWILVVCAEPAYAYVDPGSGGMIVQLLLGGVAGVAILARLFWHRLINRVRLGRGKATTVGD